MHICFLCNEYPPVPHGGIGTMTQTLGRGLVRHGYQVTVIGLNHALYSTIDYDCGVKIIRLPKSSGHTFRFASNGLRLKKALRSLHQEIPIDILDGPENGFAFVPKDFPAVKVIRMHGGHHFFAATLGKKPRPLRSFIELRSFRQIDALCAVSRFVAETTRSLLHLGNVPIEILPNPVDTDFFYPIPGNEQDGLIVFVGTLVEKKGVKQLVLAMKEIVSAIPYARLMLIGRDHPDPGSKTSTAALLVNQLPSELKAHVIFKGAVPHSDLPYYLSQAQVCAFPSHMEAQGIVALEAMAMEKATVYTGLGPGPEIIEDGISGLLCTPYDPASIAEKIIDLLSSTELRNHLGKNARQRAINLFGIEHVVDANISFYRKLKI